MDLTIEKYQLFVEEWSNYMNKEQLTQLTIKDIKKKKNIVWCSKEDIEKYNSLITKYEYYNILLL